MPLVVLTDHRAYDPLVPGHKHSLDVERIRAEVSRLLLPSQTLTLLPSTHHIHEHPSISVALTADPTLKAIVATYRAAQQALPS